jgi:hypothetical protein
MYDNDLSNLEHSITIGYPNAEVILPPNSENIYIGYSGTRYVLNIKFGDTDSNTVYISKCNLLEFNDSINVDEWVRYHHCDWGCDYHRIGPAYKYNAQYTSEITLIHIRIDTIINGETFKYYAKKYEFDAVLKDIKFEDCAKTLSILELNDMILYTDGKVIQLQPLIKTPKTHSEFSVFLKKII